MDTRAPREQMAARRRPTSSGGHRSTGQLHARLGGAEPLHRLWSAPARRERHAGALPCWMMKEAQQRPCQTSESLDTMSPSARASEVQRALGRAMGEATERLTEVLHAELGKLRKSLDTDLSGLLFRDGESSRAFGDNADHASVDHDLTDYDWNMNRSIRNGTAPRAKSRGGSSLSPSNADPASRTMLRETTTATAEVDGAAGAAGGGSGRSSSRMETELRRAMTEVDLSQAINFFRLRATEEPLGQTLEGAEATLQQGRSSPRLRTMPPAATAEGFRHCEQEEAPPRGEDSGGGVGGKCEGEVFELRKLTETSCTALHELRGFRCEFRQHLLCQGGCEVPREKAPLCKEDSGRRFWGQDDMAATVSFGVNRDCATLSSEGARKADVTAGSSTAASVQQVGVAQQQQVQVLEEARHIRQGVDLLCRHLLQQGGQEEHRPPPPLPAAGGQQLRQQSEQNRLSQHRSTGSFDPATTFSDLSSSQTELGATNGSNATLREAGAAACVQQQPEEEAGVPSSKGGGALAPVSPGGGRGGSRALLPPRSR